MKGLRLASLLRYALMGLVLAIMLLVWQRCGGPGLFSDSTKETSIHHMVVEKIESMGTVELIRYKLKDVVEQKIERSWWKGGDTRVLLIVSGEAVGCVDLKALTDKDIQDQGETLVVTLPAPQLCYAKVNHDESRVYDAPTSFFTNNADAVDQAYKNAEAKMREAALEMGILDQTKENAVKLLKPLIQNLSGKQVQILFRENGQVTSDR